MIHFKSCKWQNFLSTGNDPIEIQLDRTPTTLIVGQNGAGKSTLLDALSFGLFGKPHRDIKKGQLINSINNKKTVVEIEFNIGTQDFKIVRGIKPNKFEIWQNGNMINQASNVRDYQKFLEQNILKLDHKSFHQVVVLGSSSFIPFMQLPAWTRRHVIEDLLDINIFTKMNILLKERNVKIREQLVDLDHNLELLKTKITAQEKYIKDLQELNDDQIEKKRDSIESHKEQITVLFDESKKLGEGLMASLKSTEKDQVEQTKKMSTLEGYDFTFNKQIKDLVSESRFYEDNDHCPTCDQDISTDLKEVKQSDIKHKASELQQAKSDLQKSIEQLRAEQRENANLLNQLRQKQEKINRNNDTIGVHQAEITKIQKDIDGLMGQTGDVSKAKRQRTNDTKKKDKLTEQKLEYVEERTYNEVIGEMLKDTGIKTKVIKQYLPVMNRLINHYLQILDFFVSFHLDESFNETIRSRHRDSFNYASFSEGEKQRIDLALLFTWRHIAKMKNSASTNLLVLDETFDSSLDIDGVDNLTKILGTMDDDTNVFIISHKGDILQDKFRSKIEFFKKNNFTKIK
jgi:DNA repair exonuclease SbcCD ATPase subunit|tara:strand:- start:971 stop:2686 length:1716 start_codon:yes stop_codon:yes gene_type:complete